MLDKTRKLLFPQLETEKKHLKKFFGLFFRRMSHSAKKCKRGDTLGFINIHSVAKYQKT